MVKRFIYMGLSVGIIEMPADAPNPSKYPPYVLASDYDAVVAKLAECRQSERAICREEMEHFAQKYVVDHGFTDSAKAQAWGILQAAHDLQPAGSLAHLKSMAREGT